MVVLNSKLTYQLGVSLLKESLLKQTYCKGQIHSFQAAVGKPATSVSFQAEKLSLPEKAVWMKWNVAHRAPTPPISSVKERTTHLFHLFLSSPNI